MQLPLSITSGNTKETEKIGIEFAALLKPGDVVWLEGDLGAGKTVFARGCLRGLGIFDLVTSPTFTIARRYSAGEISVSHLDLYRLADGLDGEDLGVFDSEFGADRISLIEWPERGGDVFASPSYLVELNHLGNDLRELKVSKCQ